MKIPGVVYGNPETTTGGNALKFYASVRLDIRKIGVVKNGDVVMGTKTRVKVVKNKMAPPFREAEFEILYGTGVNWPGEIVDLGSEAGVLEKSGAYYSWNGERIAQGRDNACQWMQDNPKVADTIRERLVERRKAENAGRGCAAPAASERRRRREEMTGKAHATPRARTIAINTFAEFWCEAAVLVAVFGLLDKVMKHEDLSSLWTAATLSCAIVFLVIGTVLRILGRD